MSDRNDDWVRLLAKYEFRWPDGWEPGEPDVVVWEPDGETLRPRRLFEFPERTA